MDDSDASRTIYSPSRTFDKGTLTDRVYQSLREDILSNRLPPETPLQEMSLAEALDVSRGPIREALRRLDAEGLVSVIPRRGAVVSSLSREEFLDAYRVREALEVLAVQLATPMLASEDLSELAQLHHDMERFAAADDVDSFFAANTAFHALIVDRSENGKLQEIYHPLIDQMRRYQLRSVSLRGGMGRSCDEHGRILEAMQEGRAEEAANLLREHIHEPQRILESDSDAELVPRVRPPED